MSLQQKMAFALLMRNKRPYDRNNKPDYVSKRKREEAGYPLQTPNGVMINDSLLLGGGIHAEEYIKTGNRTDTIVMYIHGGSFVAGSARSRRSICYKVVDEFSLDVVNIDYRLAPEFPFPAAVDDCFAAYKAIIERYKGRKIVLMGESAGGNLILVTALRAKEEKLLMPTAIVAISPTTQIAVRLPSYDRNDSTDCLVGAHTDDELEDVYLSGDKELRKNPYVSPYLGDLSGFPPTYLLVSNSEVLYDDSLIFEGKLKSLGVECRLSVYEDCIHAFAIMPLFPESKTALLEIKQFLDEKLN